MVAHAILWDLAEEHLDEAAFFLELRHDALRSPSYVLDELIDGPEQRLRAHVDGLVVGGTEVATTLLRPAIEDAGDDPWRVCAAALALLELPQPAFLQPLLDALSDHEGVAAQGIAQALALAERPDLDARLQAVWGRADHGSRRALLPVLASRGLDPGRALDELLVPGDPELRAVAFTAARYSDRARYLAWIEQAVTDPDPAVARAATSTGLVLGSAVAWEAIVRRARDTANVDRDALAAVALFGDPNAVTLLRQRVAATEGRADAMWALGFTGRVDAADACLSLLEDPDLGCLAGEAFAAITGLPRDESEYWDDAPVLDDDDEALPELHDDLEEDLEIPPEDELPVPKPGAIRAWWAERRPRFDPKHRYVLGRAATGAALLHALCVEPMRRRHLLAFELSVRTKGRATIRTEALGAVQRAMLKQLQALPPIDANRPYPRI